MSPIAQQGHLDPEQRIQCLCRNCDFIEQDFGYHLVQKADTVVRWETGKAYLSIKHGDLNDGISLSFGPLRASGQSENSFNCDDLETVLEGGQACSPTGGPITTMKQFNAAAVEVANLLIELILPAIQSGPKFFDRLAEARQAKDTDFARSRSQRLAKLVKATVRPSRDDTPCPVEGEQGRPAMEPRGLKILEQAEQASRPVLEAFGQTDDQLLLKRKLALFRPKMDDFYLLFKPSMAARAATLFGAIWQREQRLPVPRPGQTDLHIDACFSEWLSHDNEITSKFPPGFSHLAHCMNPGKIWLCWRFVAPGTARGTAFNGLAYLGHRWVWLPNPHRVLSGV